MGSDRRIDSSTRDYVDNGRGEWEQTETLQTALWHDLQAELNAWPGDAEAGSEMHLLRKDGRADGIALQKAEDFVRRAWRKYLADGRLADLKVGTVVDQAGHLALRITCRDVEYGADVELDVPTPYVI